MGSRIKKRADDPNFCPLLNWYGQIIQSWDIQSEVKILTFKCNGVQNPQEFNDMCNTLFHRKFNPLKLGMIKKRIFKDTISEKFKN